MVVVPVRDVVLRRVVVEGGRYEEVHLSKVEKNDVNATILFLLECIECSSSIIYFRCIAVNKNGSLKSFQVTINKRNELWFTYEK